MGQNDFADLRRESMSTLEQASREMFNEFDRKQQARAFCRGLPPFIEKRDVEKMFPDAAEVIGGREIERGTKRDVMTETEQAFAQIFSQAFAMSPATSARIVPQVFPGLFRVMVRTWLSDLLLQCRQLTQPLPPSATATLANLSETNKSLLAAEKHAMQRRLDAVVGRSVSLDSAWDGLEVMTKGLNDDLMRQVGIQTSLSLTSACVQVARPDVQDMINRLLPSDAEFGARMSELQDQASGR
jgi:hypothetical protein